MIKGINALVDAKRASLFNNAIKLVNENVQITHDHVMTDNISCLTHFPKDKTERKVDSLNIYCENTLPQQGIHEELFTFIIYSIPQNQVICT